MAGLVKLVAPMDYPGAAISKNRTWLAGRRGKGQMNREASRWKRDLTDALTVAALGAGVRALALPLTVVVQPRYVNKREATDPHNLTELAADAVQEFCGLNDRDYTTIARAPVYGAAIPSITITVIARRADGVARDEEREEEGVWGCPRGGCPGRRHQCRRSHRGAQGEGHTFLQSIPSLSASCRNARTIIAV